MACFLTQHLHTISSSLSILTWTEKCWIWISALNSWCVRELNPGLGARQVECCWTVGGAAQPVKKMFFKAIMCVCAYLCHTVHGLSRCCRYGHTLGIPIWTQCAKVLAKYSTRWDTLRRPKTTIRTRCPSCLFHGCRMTAEHPGRQIERGGLAGTAATWPEILGRCQR